MAADVLATQGAKADESHLNTKKTIVVKLLSVVASHPFETSPQMILKF